MMKLYTDGGARGNPGHAGIGVVLIEGEKIVFQGCQYIGEKTNNEAEYLALIYGLEEALKFTKEIKVFADSELMVSQINGDYKIKKDHLKTLFKQVTILKNQFSSFSISHILRGENKAADKLVNKAIDEFLDGSRGLKEISILTRQEKLF